MAENTPGIRADRERKLDEIVFEEAVQKYQSRAEVEKKWLREYGRLGRNSSYDQAKLVLSELFNLLDAAAEGAVRSFESEATLISTSPREPSATNYEYEKDGRIYKYYKPNGRLGFGQRMAVLRALGIRIPSALFDGSVINRNATHHGTSTIVKDHLMFGETEFNQSFDNIADVLISIGRLDPKYRHPTFKQMRVKPGRELMGGEYRVGELISENAMCRVYEGVQTRFDRMVTIKELRPGRYSPDRIEKECGALQDLKCNMLPGFSDIFSENGTDYIIMEHISGTPLCRLPDDMTDFRTILEITVKLCTAVKYMHSEGRNILYSDIDPQNIIISADGTPLLTGFGISRTERCRAEGDSGFAAPEYLNRSEYTALSDIYSLGKIMEYMYSLPGARPDSTAQDSAFVRIMNRAKQEQPGDRFRDPDAMLAELNRLYAMPADRGAKKKGQSSVPADAKRKKTLAMIAGASAAAAAVGIILLIIWAVFLRNS